MALKILAAAVAAAMAGTAYAAADPARYMSADLIAESLAPAPGSTILVGLRLRPRPGWHGYWSNPGDAGFAPSIRWSAPDGVGFGPLLHPAPTLISAAGISSYVHEGEHILLTRMSIPRGLAAGTPIPVTARANWAACTATMCVPLKGTFTLDLAAGSGAKGADWAALAAAQRKLPRRAPGGTFSIDGKSVRLQLPAALRLDPRSARFFPDQNDLFKTASGRAERTDEGLVISGSAERKIAGSIGGVATDGRSAYRLTLTRSEAKRDEPKPETPVAKESAAPTPAAAPAADPDAEEIAAKAAPASKKAAEPGLWAGLLLAAALASAAAVAAIWWRRAG